MAQLLLDNGANIDLNHVISRYTGFFSAVSDDIRDVENSRNTAFFWAVSNNLQEIAVWLLHRGADVTIKGRHGADFLEAPFHAAARCGNTVLLQILLDNRVNINIRSRGDGDAVLHIAVKTDDGSLEGSRQQGTSQPLHNALAQWLLDRGANLEAKDRFSMSPLFWKLRRTSCRLQNYFLAGVHPSTQVMEISRPFPTFSEVNILKLLTSLPYCFSDGEWT